MKFILLSKSIYLYISLQKLKPIDDDSEINESAEDIDEYEMMCIRGGSPPPLTQMNDTPISRLQDDAYYNSDDSYSSYESYEEKRQSRRGNSQDRRGNQIAQRKSRDKRRYDDSDVCVCCNILFAFNLIMFFFFGNM